MMPRSVFIIGLISAVILAAIIASAVSGWPRESAPTIGIRAVMV